MDEKKKIGNRKLLVIAIVLILVVIIGTTYAWLSITKNSEIINKITAGNLELTLDDTTSEGIKLIKEVPRSYRQGMTTKEYTFTLTNKSSTSSYTLSLKDLTTYRNDEDQEVTIADEDRLADSKIRYILLKDGEEATASKSKILTDRVIDSGTIEKGKTIKYSLRIWIDSKAGDNNTEEEVMGKVFNAQLSLEATQTVTPTKTAVCKRATTLHTEVCNVQSTPYKACGGDGYSSGTEITYGNLGTNGVLTTGDAFDCDVNGDGVYDAATERFYYVSDITNGVTTDANTAVLMYYSNVSSGVPDSSSYYLFSSTNNSATGPDLSIKQLPTISQWKNVSLTNSVRNITTENNTIVKSDFDYSGYAARLLTYQEVYEGCFNSPIPLTSEKGLSDKCKFMFENTNYSTDSIKIYGTWLENSYSNTSSYGWSTDGYNRSLQTPDVQFSMNYGVRPAIEVAKTNIKY